MNLSSFDKNSIKKSITELVGNTPLLELVNYKKKHGLKAEIIAKLEYLNPTNSVKDRIAKAMIEAAEKQGLLKSGGTIVETTSGNTGIGLAAIAASRGYKFRVYIQDNVSIERTKVIRAFGSEVIPFSEVPIITKTLEETDGDFVEVINVLKNEVLSKEDNVFFVNQLENVENPTIHKDVTGPEIWKDTNGLIDIFVGTVGTGGTVSGVGDFLKSKNPNVQIVGVEPGLCSIATVENPDVPEITGVHRFSDVEENRVPSNVNKKIIDEIIAVETKEAEDAAREVAKTDGILVGTSSGAALWAATELAKRSENKGKRIVVLLPDTGLRYLSTNLFNS